MRHLWKSSLAVLLGLLGTAVPGGPVLAPGGPVLDGGPVFDGGPVLDGGLVGGPGCCPDCVVPGGPGCCEDCGGGCCPPGNRVYTSVEYLLWFVRGSPLPPLVT